MLPLAVLSVVAPTRADALRGADAATAAAIIYNLKLVVVAVALGGLAIVGLGTAGFLERGVTRCDVQIAMAQVQRGGLDARCTVVSNDERGAAAEGFNRMVQGLLRPLASTPSPGARRVAGRVSGAGLQCEVTILFAAAARLLRRGSRPVRRLTP